MKYIVYRNRKYDVDTIIVFSEMEQHVDVAMNLCIGPPIAAGMVKRNAQGELFCGGESFTMKVKSRPVEDLKILKRELEGII